MIALGPPCIAGASGRQCYRENGASVKQLHRRVQAMAARRGCHRRGAVDQSVAQFRGNVQRPSSYEGHVCVVDCPSMSFYSQADWERDWEAGRPLPCPSCGSSENFGPRQAILPDRSFRRFRSCKRCGMCQEADGRSLPYQTLLMAHECDGKIGADAQCRGCGMRLRNGGRHLCPRIVREGETFVCPECGTALTEAHRRPWPTVTPTS